MIKPRTLKGFRDFLPAEARKRQYVINILKNVFEKYGFEPLETPVLEYEEILSGKYGEEGDKLMYRFEDNGKRRVAMRYDQTVPLARVVAQYQNDLPFPFKRYQIQPVWRAENTQKGRFREFLQCDIDTVGTPSLQADAEIVACAAKSLEALGFNNYKILTNDRYIFSGDGFKSFAEYEFGIFTRSLDKIKKIGEKAVSEEMIDAGLKKEKVESILALMKMEKETPDLKKIIELAIKSGVDKQNIKFDPYMVRGLDYYTGLIFEIEIDEYNVGSVGGGGRYDKLIGMFSDKQVPAVGFAFGFDRLLEAMEELNLFPASLALSSTQVLITIFSEDLRGKSLELTSQLRSKDINTEIYLGEIKDKNPLEKQLKYADQKRIPYAAIIGPEEADKNLVTLKNLKTREQKQLTLEELIAVLTSPSTQTSP